MNDTAEETPSRLLPEYPFVLGQEMQDAIDQALNAVSADTSSGSPAEHVSGARAEQVSRELMGIVIQYAQAYPDELRADRPEGQWMHIGFFGRIELQGYVTEIVVGGQPVFHVDLPEKVFGGDRNAWEEYAANALHNRRPLTEETVRKAWEARLERARRMAEQEAEWARQQQARALEAAASDRDDEDDDDRDDDDDDFGDEDDV